MKLKENAFLWLLTGCGVVVLALALGADRESPGFFVAVRVVVCLASAYAAVKAYRAKREVWTWLLGANAALYNPFVVVRLTREVWNLVDLADIALLATAGIVLRARREPRAARLEEPGEAVPSAPQFATKAKEYRTPSRVEVAVWLTVLCLCLTVFYLSQYEDFLSGASHSEAQTRTVGSATLGLAFWAFVIAWARHWRRPGRIALGAFLAGLLTLFLASATGGYVKGTETKAETKEAVASIERFDPALAARLRAGKGSGGPPLSAMVRTSLARAVEQAPDTAVIAFTKERFALLQSDGDTALSRCVAAFNGGGDFNLTATEQQRLLQVMGRLYSAAAAQPQAGATDAERSAAMDALAAVYKKVDPAGVLDDEQKRKALSDSEKCRMYTRLMNEIQSSSPKDGAAAIRAMTAN